MPSKVEEAERLGLGPSQVVQEIGGGADCDTEFRDAIERLTGTELVDADYEDVVDRVLLWWRAGDGDLYDVLSNVRTPLADDGAVVVFSPRSDRPGHVELADINDAADRAGLRPSSSNATAAAGWVGVRLTTPKARR